MASTLEELIAKINTEPYRPMTREEMEAAANRRYQAVYDQKRQSAQDVWEASDQALVRELSALADSYASRRAQSEAQTESAYRQADRQALGRGMQRSSYHEATLSNIDLAGNAALEALGREQASQEADVEEERSLLSRQLSQQLAGFNAQQQSDTLGYLDELEAREYDRAVQSTRTSNELAMKIYEYQHELEKEAAEQARWQAEFNAKYGSRSGGSSGGGRKKSAAQTTQAKASAASVSGVRRNNKEMLY